jgi:ketosteroid isomerase-like protein
VTDDFEWRPATGRTRDGEAIDKRGIDIYEFRDGKIAVKDSYWKQVG